MTNKEKPITASDRLDGDTEPIDPSVADALADLIFPPLDQVDLKTAAAALTSQDRQALAALGSPAELISRITAASKDDSSTPLYDRTTQMETSATSNTQITARPDLPESAEGFSGLLQRLEDCKRVDHLSWSSEYRKKKIIGRGGQGTVFLAESLNEHNFPKALKVFSPKPYGDVASYYEDMERMAHVASLVYRFQVDNLVIIERFAYHNNICVMIMRWIDGFDLATLLQPSLLEKLHGCVNEERWKRLNNAVVTEGTIQSRLMPGMAVTIIAKCLRALDALHSQGIVHGDIKPSNIMLDQYGSIRLVDVGSAFELLAPPRKRSWSPQYAPPEAFEGGNWTPQSDLASLGYVLIELLSGQPAVADSDLGAAATRLKGTDLNPKLLKEKRRLPEQLDELLPAKVRESQHLMEICRRLIDPDPAKRFASAKDASEGPGGTFAFQQSLTLARLDAYYLSEIERWLADVKAALQ